MLVLALDTATPAVLSGVVRLDSGGAVATLAERATVRPRAHNELLVPQIAECLIEAGIARSELAAVVVGTGPGLFTGLRVGMVTAAAFGDALGLPVHGVCTLDAIAASADRPEDTELVVVTDARRREVYHARYAGTRRTAGPAVGPIAEVDVGGQTVLAGDRRMCTELAEPEGATVLEIAGPTAAGLVRAGAESLRTGAAPAMLEPLYLRRPDTAEPRPRRRLEVV